jgi:hypothetical protein
MRKNSSIAVFLLLLLANAGCDKLDNPIVTLNNQYLEGVYGPPPTFTLLENPVRNVFFEEFTGHVCGFCPPATSQLKAWDEEYKDRLVVLAVHAGNLAEPGAAPFEADYRTPYGDIYWGQLDGGFNPSARIDRDQGNTIIYGSALWQNKLLERLNTPTEVAMQMVTSYDPVNGNANIHLHTQFLRSLNTSTKLVILLVESGIISAQEDYNQTPSEILNYRHDNLLRDALTDPTGWPFLNNPRENDTLVRSFTYPMNPDWNPANCSVLAFIIDSSTGEVLNAAESKLSS